MTRTRQTVLHSASMYDIPQGTGVVEPNIRLTVDFYLNLIYIRRLEPQILSRSLRKMHFTNPQPRDVLCGRGISCHEHQGNKLLRQLIDRNLRRYAIADSKSDKSSILREIIRSILQEGGRFLKKDSETESYYEAGMKAAR